MATLFGILFLLVGAYAADPPKATNVTVYYESLCSDSIAFIKDKLVPTYTATNFKFSDLFSNLTLVPYGHVNVSAKGPDCQHGPSECDGNKLHACAIKYITDEALLLQYISCLMEKTLPVNKTLPYPQAEVCGTVLGKTGSDIIGNITACRNNTDGENLFNKYGQDTTTFLGSNFSVPYIAFNNIRNDSVSGAATENFRQTLCSIAGINNNACTDPGKGGASGISGSLALISVIVCYFFAKQ